MPIATILARVRSEIATAAEVPAAVVHDGKRYVKQDSEWRTLFSSGGQLHGWMVWLEASDQEVEGVNNLVLRTHLVRIAGLYAVEDDGADNTAKSELRFRTAVEDVLNELTTDCLAVQPLNGSCMKAGPPDLVLLEERMVRKHLCHYAEIELEAIERINYAP